MAKKPPAVNPEDELRGMLERVCERVLDNVDNDGWSIPICLAHSQTGEAIYVVAESADPNAELELRQHVESILAQVRRMIRKKELRCVAFARHLNLTVASADGPVESPAIKVLLDHQAGGGNTAYLLFHQENGKAVPGELFYEELKEPFFNPLK